MNGGIEIAGVTIGWSTWGLALAWIGILTFLAVQDHRSNRSPVLAGQGTLIGRNAEASHVSTGMFGRDRRLYQLTFRLSDGDELTLYAPENAYLTLKDGVQGHLRWRADTLLSFTPEEEAKSI